MIFVGCESYYNRYEVRIYRHRPNECRSVVVVVAVVVAGCIDSVFRTLVSSSCTVMDRVWRRETKSHRIHRCEEIRPSVSVIKVLVDGGWYYYYDCVLVAVVVVVVEN